MKKIIRVVGIIVQCNNAILLLYRSKSETDPSLWGIPAGKVEGDESDSSAAVRELFEETGITVSESDMTYLDTLDIEYETVTVQFPIFHKKFDQAPAITLDPNEHVDYAWITPDEALTLPDLMLDVDKIIKKFCIDTLKI